MTAESATGIPEPFSRDVDLEAILGSLVRGWRLILVCSLVGVFVAGVYAFLIAKPVYRSTSILIPTEASKTDQLGAAALLMNKKAGGVSEDVGLYQTLLPSRTVVQILMRVPVPNLSDSGKGRMEPVYRVLGLDTSERARWRAAEDRMAKSILIESNDRGLGQVVEVSVSAGSPWLAQILCDSVIRIGQRVIRQIRADRYQLVMERLSPAVEQSRMEWDLAARRVSQFREGNRSIGLPGQNLELMRLDVDLQAKEQRFLFARKELEMQSLEALKATAPMLVLDPPDLPASKLKPKRGIIMILGLLFGAFMASAYLMVRGNRQESLIRKLWLLANSK